MELYEKNGNILYILNILKKYTDEEHILSANEIKEKIKEVYDVEIDTRTIRRNITLLNEKFGYDIETWNDNKKGYLIRKDPETEFEKGEIRAIIDTFSYSNFIPNKLSNQIIKKCKNMQNIYENEKLKNYKAYMNDTKTTNLEIIKNIEDINDAIYKGKKIIFDYWKYDLTPKLESVVVRKPIVSPYSVIYSLQNFYLICLTDGEKELFSYRLDRMKNIKILKENKSNKITKLEVESYIKSNVAMFSGISDNIEVICHMDLLDNVVELFGKDIKLTKIDDNTFKANLYMNKNGFKYWVLRNIEKVKVIKPESLKKEINKVIRGAMNER